MRSPSKSDLSTNTRKGQKRKTTSSFIQQKTSLQQTKRKKTGLNSESSVIDLTEDNKVEEEGNDTVMTIFIFVNSGMNHLVLLPSR